MSVGLCTDCNWPLGPRLRQNTRAVRVARVVISPGFWIRCFSTSQLHLNRCRGILALCDISICPCTLSGYPIPFAPPSILVRGLSRRQLKSPRPWSSSTTVRAPTSPGHDASARRREDYETSLLSLPGCPWTPSCVAMSGLYPRT